MAAGRRHGNGVRAAAMGRAVTWVVGLGMLAWVRWGRFGKAGVAGVPVQCLRYVMIRGSFLRVGLFFSLG